MPRTVTSGFQGELDKQITHLVYLVQITGTQTLRWNNSGALVTYAGVPWPPVEFEISGLAFKPDSDPVCSMKVQNLDDAVGALFLTEPMADAIVDIYQFSPAALAAGDAPLLARMVFDKVTITPDALTAQLFAYSSVYQFSPRRRVDTFGGFFNALPAGTQIAWENEVFILQEDTGNG